MMTTPRPELPIAETHDADWLSPLQRSFTRANIARYPDAKFPYRALLPLLDALDAALAAAHPAPPEGRRQHGYENATMERLLAKADRWKARGMYSAESWGAICALLFVVDPEDMTEDEREALRRRGIEIAAQHPEWAKGNAALAAAPREE
jgi:hypothetical protein